MSESTTVTVNAEVVEGTTAPATQPTDILQTLKQLEEQGADNRAMAIAAFGTASPATIGERLAKLMQSGCSQARLHALLDGLVGIENDADYLPSATSQSDRVATAKVVRHYIGAFLVQSLDEQHNVLRAELCGDEGFGLYAEAGPLGFAGAGFGVVSKEKIAGRTVVKRTGAGVYIRADHFCNKATPVECLV